MKRMGVAALWCVAAVGLCVNGADGVALHSANRKLSGLADDRVPRGSVVTISAAELAAFAGQEAAEIAPGAVRNIQVLLSEGQGECSADIDFQKVRQAKGEAGTWITRQLLEGERSVRVRLNFASIRGQARVDIQRVEVSGVPMEGRTLQFLIDRFVLPNYPDALVGRWFPLEHGMERIELHSGVAVVTMRR